MIWAYALAAALIIVLICAGIILVILGLGEWFSWHEDEWRRKDE